MSSGKHRENKSEFADLLTNELWCTKLAFLSDIFDILNKYISSLQGKDENILTATDKISALRDKLAIWSRKVKEQQL